MGVPVRRRQPAHHHPLPEGVLMTTPARELPQLAVACPTCGAKPEGLCVMHAFGPTLAYAVHEARTAAWNAAQERAGQPTVRGGDPIGPEAEALYRAEQDDQ
jgi:hypothetical protein